jgi:vanillate O-demethylase ferredoxin subunit
MLPMIARLNRLGRSWELHYVAASPERAAYVAHVEAHDGVIVCFDGIPGGRRLDLKAISDAAPADAHLYCCGPSGMLDAFVAINKDRPKDHIHIEYFSAETEVATEGGYTLELARSGRPWPCRKARRCSTRCWALGSISALPAARASAAPARSRCWKASPTIATIS